MPARYQTSYHIFDPITFEVKEIDSELLCDLAMLKRSQIANYKYLKRMIKSIKCYVVNKDVTRTELRQLTAKTVIPDEVFVNLRIKGFEHFLISQYGRIKRVRYGKDYFLLPSYHKKRNYMRTVLTSTDGKSKDVAVCRLVAEHFLGIPKEKAMVKHKDKNVRNNYVGNLYYVSDKHERRKTLKKTRQESKHARSIRIRQIDVNGNIVKEYNSIAQASKDNFVSKGCINRKCNTGILYYGFYWETIEEVNNECR